MKSCVVFCAATSHHAVGAMVFVAVCFAYPPTASAQLTVTLSSTEPDPTNVSPFRVRARFSGSVSGFDESDLVITNASVSSFPGGGPNYSIWLMPDADGLITVDIPAGAAVDMGGNLNQAAGQFSIVYDSTSPTVASISALDPNPTNASTVRFTILFSEPVTGVEMTDVVLVTTGAITDATIDSVLGGGAAYIATVSGLTQEGTVQVVLTDDDSISDLATNVLGGTGVGNGDFVSGELYTIDNTPPAVAVDALTTHDTSPALTGTVNDADAAVSVMVAGQMNPGVNNGDGTWFLADNSLMLLSPGPHDVEVTATDSAGNTGTDATIDELLIVAGAGGGVIVSNLPPEETFEGVRLVLSAAAGGTNYQWFKEGVPLTDGVRINGVDTRSLVIDPAELGDTGSFTTQYENGVAKAFVETEPFALVVLPLPPPLSAGRGLVFILIAGILILGVARYRAALFPASGRNAHVGN